MQDITARKDQLSNFNVQEDITVRLDPMDVLSVQKVISVWQAQLLQYHVQQVCTVQLALVHAKFVLPAHFVLSTQISQPIVPQDFIVQKEQIFVQFVKQVITVLLDPQHLCHVVLVAIVLNNQVNVLIARLATSVLHFQ